MQREQQDPAVRLSAATARYLDALHLAAEHFAGPQAVAGLDQNADRLITGLTGELAWPTLRGHLLLLATAGADPVAELIAAATQPDHRPRSGGCHRLTDRRRWPRRRRRSAALAAGHSRPHCRRPRLGPVPGRPIRAGG